MAVVNLTKTNFDDFIKGNDKVLVDFFANWCGPCQMLSPIVDEIAEENPEISVGKVNVDEEMELAIKFDVSSIPLLLIFKGGELKEKLVGVRPKEAILDALSE